MGMKQIWDGHQLPPIGCDVLIHLASVKSWCKYTVTGYEVLPGLDGNKAHHRIFVNVRSEDGVANQRLLCDVRPIDWRDDEK